jgi:hypothetical protein
MKMTQKLVVALVSATVDKLLTESNERLQVVIRDKLPLVHKTSVKAGGGASVRHRGQASHREQRTAPGDEDINYPLVHKTSAKADGGASVLSPWTSS